jgi:hypothetical protein
MELHRGHIIINPTLGKRRSDDDLGKARTNEKGCLECLARRLVYAQNE